MDSMTRRERALKQLGWRVGTAAEAAFDAYEAELRADLDEIVAAVSSAGWVWTLRERQNIKAALEAVLFGESE